MSENLQNVSDYIKDARTLLLDKVSPYRYSDISLIVALNLALQTGAMWRPDLFITPKGVCIPSYTGIGSDPVPIEPQFRLAFVYGLVAHALKRDTEDVQDQRSNMFMAAMYALLISGTPPIVAGGTPRGPNQ